MKTVKLCLSDKLAYRLDAIAKWQNTSSDMVAKRILEEACLEIWRVQGKDLEEMMRGLAHYHSL